MAIWCGWNSHRKPEVNSVGEDQHSSYLQSPTIFCPLTSKVKGYPFEVQLPDGCAVIGVVLSDQLKSLDWRSRKVKFIERVSPDVMAMVTARVLPLFEPDTPATL